MSTQIIPKLHTINSAQTYIIILCVKIMTKVPIVAVALINLATPTYSLLFVWKDNVSMKGLDHEQSLTECA